MAIEEIFNAVLTGNRSMAETKTHDALAAGADVELVLNDGFIKAMEVVGEKFSAGEIFVPEMLMSALAMKAGLAVLTPHLTAGSSERRGTVVIGTIKGDMHDIGKNLVALMIEGAGYQVVDLGVDVSSSAFIAAASDNKADVVALSALLTTTMPGMAQTIGELRQAGITARVIVGGAPVSQAFANQIGADGYSIDAPGAVKLVKQLLA